MQYRHLGSSGLQVSALSFGSWVTFGPQIGEDVAHDCMQAAWDAGVNFFDNADSDPEVMRYLTRGQPTPLARIENEILPRIFRFYEEHEHLGYWAVHERACGDFLGWFHLRSAKKAPEEIGQVRLDRGRIRPKGHAVGDHDPTARPPS